jgi:hypothetical protein
MAKNRSVRMSEKRTRLRKKFWPDVDEECLWLRKKTKGFVTIPRGLSLILRIMDSLSPGRPLSGTYTTLWCYIWDENIITIQKPRQMALESGFGGQRSENTWRSRMKKLEELGFIKSKSGVSGEFHYVLVLNPYAVVKELNDSEQLKNDSDLYNTLVDRADEVGEITIL